MNIKNSKGFTLLEVLLLALVVLLAIFSSYFVYKRQDNSKNSQQPQSQPNTTNTQSDNPSLAKQEEGDISVITRLAKEHPTSKQYGFSEVSNIEIIENNARGNINNPKNSGALFYAHKNGSGWTILGVGQDQPGNATAKKYNLPKGWYHEDWDDSSTLQ